MRLWLTEAAQARRCQQKVIAARSGGPISMSGYHDRDRQYLTAIASTSTRLWERCARPPERMAPRQSRSVPSVTGLSSLPTVEGGNALLGRRLASAGGQAVV